MSLLDDIIAAATDDSMSTANLLRKVRVVAHRLEAAEIMAWVDHELNGYPPDAELPKNRAEASVTVFGTFSGPFGATINQQPLSEFGIPEPRIADQMLKVSFRQALATLESMAAAATDFRLPWSPEYLTLWNRLAESGKVPTFPGMALASADRVITRIYVVGIIDSIRSRALEFALDLQAMFPDAGELGGPTTESPEVRATVLNVTNNIFGDGTNIATGSQISQRANVRKGDLAGFVSAIQRLGLDTQITGEFASAISEPDPLAAKSKFQGLLSRMRTGAISVAAGIATDLAAETILEAAKQFLGLR